MRTTLLILALLLVACGAPEPPPAEPVVATFSIAAYDPATGDLGVAVQSKFLGVGTVVPWVRADVGAVATQALANPAYGPDGLRLMDDGMPAKDVVARLTERDDRRARRQLGVVDARGRAAAWTGSKTLAWSGHVVGRNYCCQGNILAGKEVVDAMAKAFEAARGALAERLVAALEAGQAAGGDKRGRQSAALRVARRGGGYLGANDRYIDLRVDDHATPIRELGRLLKLRRSFGRDAQVPVRIEHIGREPRGPVPQRDIGPRAIWERWQRLRREEDWEGILDLVHSDWREKHTLADLKAAHDNPAAAHVRAAGGTYIGTQIRSEKEAGLEHPIEARLYFALPRVREPVVVELRSEGGKWKIDP